MVPKLPANIPPVYMITKYNSITKFIQNNNFVITDLYPTLTGYMIDMVQEIYGADNFRVLYTD